MSPSNWEDVQSLSKVAFSGNYDLEGRGMRREPGDFILNALSLARHHMQNDVMAGYKYLSEDIDPHTYERTVLTLQGYKEDLGLIDFTDMLEHGLECDPVPVKLAIIDEAQDLSLLQWKVCEKILANADVTYVAGDDDQAIYRWSGAAVDYFQKLKGHNMVLGKTWRFGRAVHALALAISNKIKDRVPKEWVPKDEDGVLEYTTVRESIPIDNGENWMILVRVNQYLRKQSHWLKTKGVPHCINGKTTIREDEAAAIESWLMLQAGESITDVQVRRLYDKLVGNSKQVRRGFKDPDLPEELLYDYNLLKDKFGLMLHPRANWYDVLKLKFPDDVWYYKRVLQSGKTFDMADRINVTTIHGVKGGECDNVVLFTEITKKIYNAISQDTQAFDDEHRVFYVGVTRAKKALYISRSVNARFVYRIPRLCSTGL